ncbi:lanosterol synthase [Aspergillus lentulus]|nr:lanosterol synthase [Aspergillus lentulus]GFF40440.1 lanosterol synthase [Aspergillus lentulus]GFF62106.1 lanosterol synthase [Aspergillus lentulus]GFF81829.1 lanosterol synthase [Aspergillus lentulus]GFF86191.1 lanosterol synthase [Aspergillus lentulus]GFG13262.1 lanosterol synthase [Aspergillus lentulus]
MNAAAEGDKALANSDCPTAIRYFTQALTELPRAPAYYIKRSTAFSRLKAADGGPNFHAALLDAEIALTLARERAKRELILSAQMRRGIVLYQLERYGDAAFVFSTLQDKIGTSTEGQDRSEKVKDAMAGGATRSSAKKGYEQELPIWTLKVKGKLSKLAEGDEKARVTIEEFPKGVSIPSEKDLKKQLDAFKAGKVEEGSTQAQTTSSDDKTTDSTKTSTRTAESQATIGNAPPAMSTTSPSTGPSTEKVRHEWYQSHDSVVVTLYVKGVPKDSVDTELKDESAAIQFPLPSGADYAFTLDPLFAPIDPSASKVSVMSTKIELVLRKKTAGQKWGALEASSSSAKLADRQAIVGAAPAAESGPSYPTSSRRGAKDWDKVASTLTAKKSKGKDKERNAEKDAKAGEDNGDESDGADSIDSDYGTGDPVDAFFKKLYANADPDTRRAMVKSYVESQGTSLSTNWKEVSQGKVEARPPSD